MQLICVIYILLLKCDALSSDTAFSFAVYYHYITLLFFFVCYICWYNKLLPPFYHYALWIIIFKRVFFYAFYIVFLHIINFILYNAGFTHFLGKKYCKLIGTQTPPEIVHSFTKWPLFSAPVTIIRKRLRIAVFLLITH